MAKETDEEKANRVLTTKMASFKPGKVLGVIMLDNRPKEGLYNVRYRLTYNRERKYISTNHSYTLKDWERINSSNIKNDQLKKERDKLINEFILIEETVSQICDNGEYSHDKLTKLLQRGHKDSISAAIEIIIEEMKESGQVGSASVYSNVSKSIKKYANKELTFADITPKWLLGYEKAVNNDLSYTTIGIYLRTLRAVFNRAIVDGIITEAAYPFSRTERDGKYRIPTGTGTKIALTIEQMAAVVNYTPSTESMERSRDLFLLSFHLGGINFKDLLLLKWSDLKNGEITFVREKTKRNTKQKEKAIYIPVNKHASALITKLKGVDNSYYILPYMKPDATPTEILRITQNITRQVNKHLVAIGKSLNIEGLSTYVARHSFATIMKNRGVSVAFISETLGHNDVKTTQNYLKSFESEQRKENFDLLNDILKQQC